MTTRYFSTPSPWISIIIPTWNASGYLNEALRSICDQHDDLIEIIVIDDGSTDQTVDVVNKYAKRLPIRLLIREHAGNWVDNTNAALSMATAPFVSFLHQDDIWLPGRLKRLQRLTKQHPNGHFFFHPTFFIDSRGRKTGIWNCPLPPNQNPVSPSLIFSRLMIQNFIAVSAVCIRKDFLKDVGLMDNRLWYAADWGLWLSLVSTGVSIYCPEPLSCFRIHPESQTMQRQVDPGIYNDQNRRVLVRHLPRLNGCNGNCTEKAAHLSVAVNTALYGMLQGDFTGTRWLFRLKSGLDPAVWKEYLRYSGIWNRCQARLKANLWRRAKRPYA